MSTVCNGPITVNRASKANVCKQSEAVPALTSVGFCRTGYHLATPSLAALARSEHIYKTIKFSDHAPITVDYEFTL